MMKHYQEREGACQDWKATRRWGKEGRNEYLLPCRLDTFETSHLLHLLMSPLKLNALSNTVRMDAHARVSILKK